MHGMTRMNLEFILRNAESRAQNEANTPCAQLSARSPLCSTWSGESSESQRHTKGYCLLGRQFQFCKMKRVLEMNDYTTV